MKKVLLTILILFLWVGTSLAAGTCGAPTTVWHTDQDGNQVLELKWSWTSDASGDVDACTATTVYGYVILGVTNPGATAPTDDYDIVVNDSVGADVFGAVLANRDTANTEQQVPQINGLNVPRYVAGTIEPIVSNAGNAKVGDIHVFIQP
jgi:hypothetical protein